MATQSLYRRYRPRRFAEIKGQDHVVRALRDSVAGGREGQAYLFSGPRGTGKTTSARILAKVLNCERPVDGEPCCECASCVEVERGVSYDVHELDAASNNGVEAMRDLIEKAQLGTPGRHKVYILDEVHMLSKPAEAALLKTLEEPPSHVVFVLATTDPQKVSDTIRSRTQHLRFHLLAPDTLAEHVRWVAADAGLDIGDEAVAAAVSQGAGSARDTLSALELIASSGGDLGELLRFDDFVEALIEHDPGLALTAMAGLVNAGHDPRTIAEELVKHLRNGFLTLMAPELVSLPAADVDALAAQAQRLGAPSLVGAVERLGETLIELRHAPDPRVLVEVALVQLTRPRDSGDDLAGLVARVAKLEKFAASPAAAVATAPAPVDPSTGRTKLGGRAQRSEAPAAAGTAGGAGSASPSPGRATSPSAGPATSSGEEARASGGQAEPSGSSTAAPGDDDSVAGTEIRAEASSGEHSSSSAGSSSSSSSSPTSDGGDPSVRLAPPVTDIAPAGAAAGDLRADWAERVRPSLKGFVRALFAPVEFVEAGDGTITLTAPNAAHQAKSNEHLAAVEQAWLHTTGRSWRVVWVDSPDDAGGRPASSTVPAASPRSPSAPAPRSSGSDGPTGPTDPRPSGPNSGDGDDQRGSGDVDRFDHLQDIPGRDALDEPDDSRPAITGGQSVLDRVAQAFPGAQRVDGDG